MPGEKLTAAYAEAGIHSVSVPKGEGEGIPCQPCADGALPVLTETQHSGGGEG